MITQFTCPVGQEDAPPTTQAQGFYLGSSLQFGHKAFSLGREFPALLVTIGSLSFFQMGLVQVQVGDNTPVDPTLPGMDSKWPHTHSESPMDCSLYNVTWLTSRLPRSLVMTALLQNLFWSKIPYVCPFLQALLTGLCPAGRRSVVSVLSKTFQMIPSTLLVLSAAFSIPEISLSISFQHCL